MTTYFLLLYEVVPDYLERRTPFRAEHLALLRAAHERGELLMAGAFAEPADGAAFIFTTGDRSVVERFVGTDPYVREGIVLGSRIRSWSVVVGGA